MAAPAVDAHASRWAVAWSELLAPFPGRFEFALRLALVCLLSAAVAEWFQTPEVALTAYVGFFLLKPDRATSIVMGLAMMIAASLLIGLVALLANVLIGRPAALLGAMTLISFGALFLTSSSKLQPVGGILALITAFALSLIGLLPEGELATRALLYAWLMVLIPVCVSTAVNLLAGPAPRRLAERALSQRLAVAAAQVRGGSEASRQALSALRSQGSEAIDGWLRMARLERSSPAEDLLALRRASDSITQLLRLVESLDMQPADAGVAAREQLADLLSRIAAILAQGGYPTGILPDGPPVILDAQGESGTLAAIYEVLAHFADAEPVPPDTEEKAGFFAADAFSNPEHVRFALKATGTAMFCYLLYNALDWQGIHTAFITCFIVALGTAAETVEKLTLRLTGCLVGAALGMAALLWVVPHLQGLGGLLALLFPVTLLATWISAGSSRVGYIGFQLAFAFYLCVLQGNGPSDDLAVASDRVIGILLGNGVVYLVFTRCWPISLAQRIDPALAQLLHRLGRIAQAPQSRAAWVQAGKADGERARIASELALLAYEPPRLRPSDTWIRQRHRTLAGASVLEVRLAPLRKADAAVAPIDALGQQLVAVTEGDGSPPPTPTALPDTLPDTLLSSLRELANAVQDHRPIEGVQYAAH